MIGFPTDIWTRSLIITICIVLANEFPTLKQWIVVYPVDKYYYYLFKIFPRF